ncbi:MAG: TIM-barrel domain-containing protein [Oscillospiraceae bacterium]
MQDFFKVENGALLFKFRYELVSIMPWGDGLRVRATQNTEFIPEDWALSMPVEKQGNIELTEDGATVTSGKVTAKIDNFGRIRFYNQKGEMLLDEFYRTWDRGVNYETQLNTIIQMKRTAREYKGTPSNNFEITMTFEANEGEKLFGMGQYQQPYLDLKGCSLELAQRNTQASVPFLLSSKGYGFLWNNPGVGTATFAKNVTEWKLKSSKQIDYWITAGDTPAEIEENYAKVSGTVPMMPDYGTGFWQCKLRYQTQEELLEVAREYHKRGIPIDVIVVDFFHWPHQGDWKFDEAFWPDPEAMIKELDSMGMKLMTSVWPTVDKESENYNYMKDHDLLVRVDHGINFTMDCFGSEGFFDATNPEAQKFVFETCKKNYLDKGVTLFWLDEAEPEYTAIDFENYRYHKGAATEVANYYPVGYAKGFYDGMKGEGREEIVNLIRCAWAGSQRYGALAWSGDVPSTFEAFRNQMAAGLNMGLAGITWWTADIGGFHGGNIYDENFRELITRWFEFGAFCPVMRLHGDRDPHDKPQLVASGGGYCPPTGADNEVWSYGPAAEEAMTKYIKVRYALKPYIKEAMKAAHEKGTPVIRPVFYDFPSDKAAWDAHEEYLFGSDLLVAPVLYPGARTKEVYLPAGSKWVEVETGKVFDGGQAVTVDAPLNVIPLFAKEGAKVLELF